MNEASRLMSAWSTPSFSTMISLMRCSVVSAAMGAGRSVGRGAGKLRPSHGAGNAGRALAATRGPAGAVRRRRPVGPVAPPRRRRPPPARRHGAAQIRGRRRPPAPGAGRAPAAPPTLPAASPAVSPHGHALHLRVGLRGPPRQGRRPDLRRALGRLPGRRPCQPVRPSRPCARPGWSSSRARSRAAPTSTSRRSCAGPSRRSATPTPRCSSTPGAAGSWSRSTSSRPTSPRASDDDKGAHQGQGAGDQGMMFGYATREDPETLMPLAPRALAPAGGPASPRSGKGGQHMPYLRPDAKSQVTVEYADDDRTVRRVHTVVVSTQHDAGVAREQIEADLPRARPTGRPARRARRRRPHPPRQPDGASS